VLDDLRATTKGGRNNALNKAAFRLGQFVGAEWSPLDHATAEAELWAAARATGLPDREIAQCLKHAIDDGAREPEPMLVDRPRPTKIVHSSPMPEAAPHDELFDEVSLTARLAALSRGLLDAQSRQAKTKRPARRSTSSSSSAQAASRV
jgi:hypothetical protein